MKTTTLYHRLQPLVLLAVLSLAGFALTGCEEMIPGRTEGEKLWRKHCAECHGFNGVGHLAYQKYRGINLVDDYWKYGGDEPTIEAIILDGVFPAMPGFNEELTGQQVQEILKFMRKMRGES